MPSSSSSEEDLSKFKEATDSTFYNNSLFKERHDKTEKKPSIIKPPSLRFMEEEEERLHNELRVTPEFQMHVAKHLSQLLDKQLQVKDTSAGNVSPPTKARSVLKAKRGKNPSGADPNDNSGGVRLFGASAVFLSNLNIVPALHRRRKRGRKFACFSSGSESSSEESDADAVGMSTASVIPSDEVLKKGTPKCWDSKNGKDGRSVGVLLPFRDDLSRGYESLTEISSSSNQNSKEALNFEVKDDIAFLKRNKKTKGALESESAASVSSVVTMGSDSQGDLPNITKKKKIKKKKKRRKEQHSEDATTETTEVEDVIEERRKKLKKGRKKPKRQRIEERQREEMAMIRECVPGLLEDNEDDNRWKRKEKKKKKKHEKVKREESYLKNKSHHSLSKISKRPRNKKKMKKEVLSLSEDLAKLMMTPTEMSCSEADKV